MKRNLLISGAIATFVTLFGTAGISSSELDLPGLNQRIDNIDARTTNNEKDIKTLQEAMPSAPAAHVDVSAAATTKLQAVPQPTVGPPLTSSAVVAPAATPAPTPDVPVFSGVRRFVSSLMGPTLTFTCTWSSGYSRPATTKDAGQDPVCPAQ